MTDKKISLEKAEKQYGFILRDDTRLKEKHTDQEIVRMIMDDEVIPIDWEYRTKWLTDNDHELTRDNFRDWTLKIKPKAKRGLFGRKKNQRGRK